MKTLYEGDPDGAPETIIRRQRGPIGRTGQVKEKKSQPKTTTNQTGLTGKDTRGRGEEIKDDPTLASFYLQGKKKRTESLYRRLRGAQRDTPSGRRWRPRVPARSDLKGTHWGLENKVDAW